MFYAIDTSGLYHKHMTIVTDASRFISKWLIQIVVSIMILTDDTS